MESFSKYKIIFFLSSVLVITTIIGEFERLASLKEGMDFGGLIMMFIKLILCFGLLISMIVQVTLWVIMFCVVWLPQGLFWGLQYLMCVITGFMNIPNCFLWYVAEIMGTIIYLPFRLVFYVLDLLLYSLGSDFSIKEDIVDKFWWFLDDISHLMHDELGISHIVHFPDEIINKCYTCKVPPRPEIPDMFFMSSVTALVSCMG
jgi:hypothetical protein